MIIGLHCSVRNPSEATFAMISGPIPAASPNIIPNTGFSLIMFVSFLYLYFSLPVYKAIFVPGSKKLQKKGKRTLYIIKIKVMKMEIPENSWKRNSMKQNNRTKMFHFVSKEILLHIDIE